MNTLALAMLVTSMSLAADGAGDAASDEHEKLDGTWVVESIIRDPREENPDEGKGIQCVIKEEKVVAKIPAEGGPARALIIKIDPTQKPKTLDIRPEGETDTVRAIYELNGDTLRVCWSPVGKERPAEFASKPGSGNSLVVLKRGER